MLLSQQLGAVHDPALFSGTATSSERPRSKSSTLPPPLPPARDLSVPWAPILSDVEVSRGLAYYGSGRRLERVAAKLLAGKPLQIVALGGTVTAGGGASDPSATSYPARFFEYINASFPHSEHTLTSLAPALARRSRQPAADALAACLDSIVAPGTDLIVLDVALGKHADEAGAPRQQRAYEQLLRTLLGLPGRPAIVQLQYYAWWEGRDASVTTSISFNQEAEGYLAAMAQYYDVPSLSLRAAVHPLMQAAVPGFRVEKVLAGAKAAVGLAIPIARPGEEPDFFYADRRHPADLGHKVLAELLAGLLTRSVEQEEGADCGRRSQQWADREVTPALRAVQRLPPALLTGDTDAPVAAAACTAQAKRQWGGSTAGLAAAAAPVA